MFEFSIWKFIAKVDFENFGHRNIETGTIMKVYVTVANNFFVWYIMKVLSYMLNPYLEAKLGYIKLHSVLLFLGIIKNNGIENDWPLKHKCQYNSTIENYSKLIKI